MGEALLMTTEALVAGMTQEGCWGEGYIGRIVKLGRAPVRVSSQHIKAKQRISALVTAAMMRNGIFLNFQGFNVGNQRLLQQLTRLFGTTSYHVTSKSSRKRPNL